MSECYACKGFQFEEIFEKDGYTCSRCIACGLGRIDPLPTAAVLDNLYQGDYFEGGKSAGYEQSYLATEAILRNESRELLRWLPKRRGSLFEIGTGHGFFLDEARRSGYSVSGIEVNDKAVQLCRDALRLPVRKAAIQDLGNQTETFETVVLLDVLEHLLDPREALRIVYTITARQGVLLLRVPDFGSRKALRLKAAWDKARPPAHIWYYTEKSLRMLLDEAGFRLVKTRRFGEAGLCSGTGQSTALLRRMVSSLGPLMMPLRLVPKLLVALRGDWDNLALLAVKKS